MSHPTGANTKRERLRERERPERCLEKKKTHREDTQSASIFVVADMNGPPARVKVSAGLGGHR
eukprot:6857456-Prorocentrum_lima.AAC.1